MEYIEAKFLTTAVKPEQYPDTFMPEIAFVGRSNVGKSSLINCLTNRACQNEQLARKDGNNQFLRNKKFVPPR